MTVMRVVTPGARTTFQDAGRFGYTTMGVPTSGFADQPAAAIANTLVGQPAGSALLETMGALIVTFNRTVTVAVTGPGACAHASGKPVPTWQTVTVPAHTHLTVHPPAGGLYAYLAVQGGFNTDAQQVLGSASTCTLSGLGPPPLSRGTTLRLGPAPDTDRVAFTHPPAPTRDQTVRVLPGPHTHLFPAGTLASFCRDWTVSPQSSRAGVRLTGTPLTVPAITLGSMGVITGAVQIPPSGQPLILGPDHGTTGGYPVLAVILRADLPLIAQTKPGTHLHITAVTTAPTPVTPTVWNLAPLL